MISFGDALLVRRDPVESWQTGTILQQAVEFSADTPPVRLNRGEKWEFLGAMHRPIFDEALADNEFSHRFGKATPAMFDRPTSRLSH